MEMTSAVPARSTRFASMASGLHTNYLVPSWSRSVGDGVDYDAVSFSDSASGTLRVRHVLGSI